MVFPTNSVSTEFEPEMVAKNESDKIVTEVERRTDSSLDEETREELEWKRASKRFESIKARLAKYTDDIEEDTEPPSPHRSVSLNIQTTPRQAKASRQKPILKNSPAHLSNAIVSPHPNSIQQYPQHEPSALKTESDWIIRFFDWIKIDKLCGVEFDDDDEIYGYAERPSVIQTTPMDDPTKYPLSPLYPLSPTSQYQMSPSPLVMHQGVFFRQNSFPDPFL